MPLYQSLADEQMFSQIYENLFFLYIPLPVLATKYLDPHFFNILALPAHPI
jgi:hypothetical protein